MSKQDCRHETSLLGRESERNNKTERDTCREQKGDSLRNEKENKMKRDDKDNLWKVAGEKVKEEGRMEKEQQEEKRDFVS